LRFGDAAYSDLDEGGLEFARKEGYYGGKMRQGLYERCFKISGPSAKDEREE